MYSFCALLCRDRNKRKFLCCHGVNYGREYEQDVWVSKLKWKSGLYVELLHSALTVFIIAI